MSRFLIFLMVILVCCGCGPATSRTAEDITRTAEVSWDEHVTAVRAGVTTKLQSNQPITSEQLLELAEGCYNLQQLEADVSQISGDVLVKTLGQLPNLKQLVLTGTSGNNVLTSAAMLSKLKILNLPHASFDDAGLALMERHPTLELLRIESPQVTDAGIESIAKIPQLRYLHLIEVPLTDAGLKQLYPLKHLESFYLDGGACTEEGLSDLVKVLPELHFHWNQLHLPSDPHKHSHD